MQRVGIFILLTFGLGQVLGQEGRLIFNEGTFVLDWALNEEVTAITFKAHVTDVLGWVGIGWSMINGTSGDLVIAEVDPVNKTNLIVGDFWGFRQGPPDYDVIQNIENASGSRNEKERTATFEFTRQLISNDTIEDYPIPLDGIHIVWAVADGETYATNHIHRDFSPAKIIFKPDSSSNQSRKPVYEL